jgi:hypothetical protein
MAHLREEKKPIEIHASFGPRYQKKYGRFQSWALAVSCVVAATAAAAKCTCAMQPWKKKKEAYPPIPFDFPIRICRDSCDAFGCCGIGLMRLRIVGMFKRLFQET